MLAVEIILRCVRHMCDLPGSRACRTWRSAANGVYTLDVRGPRENARTFRRDRPNQQQRNGIDVGRRRVRDRCAHYLAAALAFPRGTGVVDAGLTVCASVGK